MGNEDDVKTSKEALDIYRDELLNSDEKIKLESAEKLSTIAIAVGEELTRTKLIGILREVVPDLCFHDEVQLRLLQELEKVVEFLGGWQHGRILIPIYEQLAGSEEVLIRSIITESVCKICNHLPDEAIDAEILEFIDRLVKRNWFASKCTVAGLFKLCHQRGNEQTKMYLRTKTLEFCEDDNPLLRKTYAVCLNGLVRELEEEFIQSDVIPLYLKWNEHDQEQIRIMSIDLALSLAYSLREELVEAHIISAMQRSATDASWRVRKEMAAKLLDIQKSLKAKHATVYIQMAKLLAIDQEASTRETLTRDIIEFCLNLKELGCADYKNLIATDMMEIIRKLSQDTFDEVRILLSETMMELHRVFDADEMRRHLLPIILASLNMEPRKVVESYVGNLNTIIASIGYENLGDDVERIMFDLLASASSRWRARRFLIVTIRIIAKYSHKDYFAKTIVPYYHKLLGDTVFSNRRTAPFILPTLIHRFGMSWTKQYVLHKVFYGRKHANYLYRMVVLFCVDEMIHPTIKEHLIELQEQPEILAKMTHLSDLLDKALNDEWVATVCNNFSYDFPEELMTYTDDLLDLLETQEADSPNTQPEDENYLVALYCLLLKYVIGILKEMSLDKVDNVKSRCVRTIENIIYLNHNVQTKLEANREKLTTVTEDQRAAWLAEVDRELQTKDEYMGEAVKQLDRGKSFEKPAEQPRLSAEISYKEGTRIDDIGVQSEGILIDADDFFAYYEENNETEKESNVDSIVEDLDEKLLVEGIAPIDSTKETNDDTVDI